MFGSRINCRACHTQTGSDFKGDVLVQATADTCVACHGEDYRSLLDQWIHEVGSHLQEANDVFERLNKRLESLRAQGRAVPEEVDALAKQASHNLHLVLAGNGIHNKNYAFNLLDAVRASVRRAEDLLPPP
jgi:predicted CXXCH cytochrome family protein